MLALQYYGQYSDFNMTLRGAGARLADMSLRGSSCVCLVFLNVGLGGQDTHDREPPPQPTMLFAFMFSSIKMMTLESITKDLQYIHAATHRTERKPKKALRDRRRKETN